MTNSEKLERIADRLEELTIEVMPSKRLLDAIADLNRYDVLRLHTLCKRKRAAEKSSIRIWPR